MWKRTKIRSILLVCGLMSMTACATQPVGGNPEGRMIQDGQTFTMHAGERVTFADSSALRYLRVTNDSRCPPNVQCVWAGEAKIGVVIAQKGMAEETKVLTLASPDSQATAGNLRIRFVGLAPVPRQADAGSARAYVAQLVVDQP